MFKVVGPLDPEKDHFVGRVQELTQMRKWVKSVEPYGLVLGASQTGKTSLLRKLQAELRSRYTCVYLNLQPFSDLDQSQVYQHLCEQIVEKLCNGLEKKEWPPVDYGLAFIQFLKQLSKNIDSSRIVLLLDEMDALSKQSLGNLANTIRGVFHEKMRERELRKLVFIYAAKTDMLTLAEGQVSPLRNITECLYLEDLSRSETIQLLEHGFAQEGIQIEETIADHIYGWTHGHPYLTQALGYRLVEMKQGGGFRPTKTNMDKAVQLLQEKGDSNLQHVVNALERARSESPALLEKVRDILESRGKIRFSRTDPELLQLELIGIVRKGEDGYCTIRNQIYQEILQNVIAPSPYGETWKGIQGGIRTAQIFLSYTRLDEEKVEDLYQKLSAAGFKPWMDKKDILPGERWKSSIQKAVQRSDFFLACLSANSVNKRGSTQKEIKDALDIWREKLEDDIYLIPIRLEDCEIPEGLSDVRWVDLFEEDGWAQLVKAIRIGMERWAEVPADEELSPATEMATPGLECARGDKVGRYEIVEELGRGAMSVVYKAHDPDIDRWVALKVMHFGRGAQSEELKRRFKREAISAGRLRHPNIVAVHDAGEDRGKPFIVMEYLEGPTLAQAIKIEFPLALERVISIISQMSDALDYAHRNGVVHRDIKPLNIFLLENDQVKVADFGTAKLISASDLTQNGRIHGTFGYASPEQLRGQEIDGRTDIFSLGIVIYEMLTGRKPFEKENIDFMISRTLDDKPLAFAALDSELLPGVKEVLLKATAKDVNERYRMCVELAQDLRRCPTPRRENTTLADRYVILRALGEGGMGAAYLVKDERLGRQCVAKASTMHDTDHYEQFRREAQMLAALDHPNLPKVYDYFFDRGHPYLIMQYVEGATLDRLKEGRLAPFEVYQVLRWANDLLDALIYLHSQEPPVIHRDIKPSNVCITPEGKAVLLDFGIARRLDETSTRPGAQAHSMYYAPIEQYPAEAMRAFDTLQQYLEEMKAADIHTGPYSDVYSLGATLYFALTLHDPLDACLRQLGGELCPIRESNSDVPDFLVKALDRALMVDPRQRCQTASEMRKLLQA
jgi:serine/threonine protein kinase